MATAFTNVGEFRRGKGNRKTRLGPRINVQTAGRQTARQSQTPDDIARNRLLKLLSRGLSVRDRYEYVGQLRQAEQIRYMNMAVLAEVIMYLHSVGNEINTTTFTYNNILPYIDRLLPQKESGKQASEDDLNIMRLRLAATFLRYIHYIIILRTQAAQELETARQLQLQTPFIEE